MNTCKRKDLAILLATFISGLLFMGLLRWSGQQDNYFTNLAGLATPGYIIITAVITIILIRWGLPLPKLGFGVCPDKKQIILVIAGLVCLRFFSIYLSPLIEQIIGMGRDLERFSDIQGSPTALWGLMLTNWTFAAFGEEFAYRIILMRGLAHYFDDTGKGKFGAIIIQALVFGLAHAYQGPAGIIESTISGLIFGTITIIAGWSIWPAALVHGINNIIGILEFY